MFYEVLKRKNAFQGYKNKKLKNLQNCDFSKGVSSSMVLLQNWSFFDVVISAYRGYENVFYDELERTNAFLGYVKKKLRNLKSCDFSKGISP